ncbi:hypothetical protein M405DRAFT_818908 [Rhizopogon salebrosus TDB-379]|nr:hypothetical protein M405DRAFT_818908 [Rhizopogon salebrosus TDB-379]
MAYDDEHADILGGPILQNPHTGFLGQWSQYSIFFRASLILGLGLFLFLISVRTWDIWKKNKELGYRKAMRRKHGIPDSDCRPFAVAYAAATRARTEREAQEKQNANKVQVERPVMEHPLPLSDTHGLRRRAAEPATKPHVYQLPTARRTVSGHDQMPNGFDFAQRYNPRIRDGVLPLAVESLLPGKRSAHRRASRKDLVLDADAAVEGKKRSFDDHDSFEPESSKKSRVDGEELIDGDEEPVWYEEEDVQPTQRGSKRTFDSDEEDDYMRTDGRDKRPRNISRGQTPEDQEMGDVEDDDVAELYPILRGKKRDRAEAGSTFGGDEEEEEALDDQDDKAHRHRKRRTVQSRKSDVSSRGNKRDRDPESPTGQSVVESSYRLGERTSKKKKRGKKVSLDEAASDVLDGSQDPLCKGRKVGEEWESNGVQYKVGNEGQRLRLTLVKKARSKYSMPKDSQHPDKQANMEIYVETWLTDEQHKDAEERQELVWQETPRASTEPSTPSEVPGSPVKTGKDLLWDSMKNSPVPRRPFRQSLTNGAARVNPFQQPLPQVSTGRRVASSNSHTPPLIHGVAEVPSRPGFRAFSKWEKQDLEAEAMARMRARMLEQKRAETPSRMTPSATAPELGPRAPTIPIITFTPPPPTPAAPAPSGTEAKAAPPAFSFGPTPSSTEASKTSTAASTAAPARVTPVVSAPASNTSSPFTVSAPQTVSAAPKFSLGQPATQPPTTPAPTTAYVPPTSAIPNFFAKPVPASAFSTTAPATTTSSTAPSFSFGPTSAPSPSAPAAAAPATAPSFSFGPTPAQPHVPTPTTTSAFPAPSTETSKPAPFTFAKPSSQPSAASTSASAQTNPPSMTAPTTTTTPPAPAPLKFDFGRKTNSATSKPAATSSTTTTVDVSKPAGPSFSFAAANPQASTSGTSSSQKFSFGQPSSAPVFGSGGNTNATSKPAETSDVPKAAASENEKPKFSFGPSGGSAFGSTGASSAPKSTFNFGPQSGTSAFATAASGGDTKKEAPLSIFGAANTAKEDASKVAAPASVFGSSSFGGASSNFVAKADVSKTAAPSPASGFGSSGFATNGATSSIFGKSSAPSGDASMSASTSKSMFGNGMSSNPFSTTPAGSPGAFGSTQPSTSSFGNESAKPADSSKSSPFGAPSNATSVFSFGKKDDTAVPSSSGASALSTSALSFQKPAFGEPSSGTSNGSAQPQSVFGKPSTPTLNAFGFGGGTGTGNGNSPFTFGGQGGGQNQQQ